MRKFGDRLLLVWQKYDHYINLGGMATGFMFDLWLAKRPDSVADNILLVVYLFICGTVIILLNTRVLRRQMEKEHPSEPLVLLLVLQFCFGGLANNLLILYGKSGTLGGSFLFVILLAVFALGNEFLKGRYTLLRLNVAIYYFLLLTYCIIAVPTFLLHAIGAQVFLISGAISLAIIAVFLWILSTAAFRHREKRQVFEVGFIVCGVFIVFSGLYFLNIIPPVPLSVKGIGIYHSVSKLPSGDYVGVYEDPAWYVFWRDTASSYTYTPGSEAYCFSAIFAPGSLTTPIVHEWEKYNADTGQWEPQSTFTFPINGGRAEGYRGWSTERLTPGTWRCNVKTARGQLIGRISFSAQVGTPPELSSGAL